jgi:hypothetical protein
MKLKTTLLLLAFALFSSVSVWAQNYVYQEEFNSQGNWTKGNDENRELYVSNGKYYFEHKKSSGFREFTTRTFYLNKSKDFEMETSILKISGEQDYGMSFLFDYKDDNDYREFGITSTGYYRVAESKDGSYSTIKGWTSSSYVKQGNYATNKLKIKKKGNRLTFYINDSYVYGMDYRTFLGSQIGFRLWRDQKVAIDYFRVKYSGGSTTNTTTTNTGGKTILFEGFNNNNNNWSTKDDSNVRLAVQGGDYIMDHKRETGGWAATIKRKIDKSRNFRITGQIKKVSGIQNNGFGLVFGKQNNSNQNMFLITGSGSYKIVQFENGQETLIKAWTSSSYIKTGDNKYNYLKVQKVGSAYKFYINSNLVHTSYSVKLYGESVGFALYDRQSIRVGYLSMNYEDGGTNTNTNTTNTNTTSHTSKETIIFDGYTDNRNNWSTLQNENVKLEIKNGNYYFDHTRAKGGFSSTIVKYIDTSRDFKILADIKKESGIQGNGYGIVFGRKDKDNQNLFYVNGNGSYSINKMENGQNNFLKQWAKSSAVRKGNGGYNVLKVVKVGNKLEYYINNTKVHTDYNPKFFGDRLGYILYDKQKISIAYLSVGYLDKKKTNTNTNTNTVVTDNISNYTYSNSGYHFSDQFNDNSNKWFLTNDDKIDFNIKNGKYYLKHKRTEKGWSSYGKTYVDTSRDFEIETKIDKISGLTNYGYGLLFGKKGNNDFRFYISSSGYYKVARNVNGKEEVIKKWTTTSFVNTGNMKSNVLKVKKQSGYYKFYINNDYVFQTEYEPFFGDDMGYVLFNNQEIAVDYLRIKYLASNTTVAKTMRLPFRDNFNSNVNGWSLSDVDNYSSSISSGRLTINRKKEGGIFISRNVDIDTSKDFAIETSMSREKYGASGLYGITFGRKNSSNEFTFLISSKGNYSFRKFENNKYESIIPSTYSKTIKTGIGQKNKIKIVKSGNLLRFYINGQYMNEATFENFFGNKLGYTVYYEQKVNIDYLDVKYQSSAYNAPPVVVITEPDVDLKRGFKIVKTKKIPVRGKATDKDGIYEVLINGVDATVQEDGSFFANVPLKIGTNELVVKATDIKQASSTKRFTIKRKSPDVDVDKPVVVNKEKLDVGFGKYYALLIGVSDYNEASNIPNLEGLPTKDAKDLKDVLVTQYSFDEENVVLLNNDPTENQILREFVKLKKKVTNKDNVLIFFAGHGIYDEATETGSWLPSDADPEYGLNLISNSTIKDYIKGINSKHTLLISDACFSGSIFKTRSYKTAPKSITRKFELPSRKAITSGTLKTVPNKSVFLKYLIDRLKNNDELYLTARKIFDRIEEPVMNNSKNVPQYGTIQEVGDEGGDFVFIRKE